LKGNISQESLKHINAIDLALMTIMKRINVFTLARIRGMPPFSHGCLHVPPKTLHDLRVDFWIIPIYELLRVIDCLMQVSIIEKLQAMIVVIPIHAPLVADDASSWLDVGLN